MHGNTSKVPVNKTSDSLKEKAVELVLSKYHDFNMLHCLEKLEEDYNLKINREVFRIWCHDKKHIKKAKKRKAKAHHRRD